MADESSATTYFDKGGPAHTDETLRLARARADQLGIRSVVVASYTGATGAAACKAFEGLDVVVVAGFVGPDRPADRMLLPEHRKVIEAAGAKAVVCGHAFGMIGRAVHNKFKVIQIDEIIANVLRLFSQGVKVACEISCMAADAGSLAVGEPAIAIAGTAHGADTAVVLKPANTQSFFDMRIQEIICKPRG